MYKLDVYKSHWTNVTKYYIAVNNFYSGQIDYIIFSKCLFDRLEECTNLSEEEIEQFFIKNNVIEENDEFHFTTIEDVKNCINDLMPYVDATTVANILIGVK